MDALSALHQRALEATGGSGVVLFELDARGGAMHATSGHRLESLPIGPWVTSPPEAALVADALSRTTPTLVTEADRQTPELSLVVGTASILLLPLVRGAERVGLLAIGLDRPPTPDTMVDGINEVADAMVVALELFSLRQNAALQRDIRRLLDALRTSLGTTLSLSVGLDAFCQGALPLFGADTATIWLHDRRSRQLISRASSDPAHAEGAFRVAVDDQRSPAALALRHKQAEIIPPPHESATATITVPLRGCRRALGTLVFEGVRMQTGDEFTWLDRADELGRQLSTAIESIQLLDDVVRSRRELENLFDSIAHLIVVADRRGRIIHANHAFATRVGAPREQLVDKALADFVGPDVQSWLASHTALAHEGQPAMLEVTDPQLNGPFMITLTDLLNHQQERVGTVLVARDLAPEMQLDAEREELRQRLLQSEKLAALGQFVAGIAHELNNPLQAVLGHMELLRVTGAFPKELRREARMIYREAERAAKIVRNLLIFSGARRLARRPVSINAVIVKVMASRMRACRAAEIELVRDLDQELPRVQSDPLLLHQVFLNIVMNAEYAIAATGHGGRIYVSTRRSADERIAVSVRDTGRGIPPEVLSRIFEPFYTTKDVGKGTGLGLAISYGIVQEHGGHIAAVNHPDGGAMFTVDLPTRFDPSEAAGTSRGAQGSWLSFSNSEKTA
ncbi:MAG: hypothetical protein C5B48_03665 [Candidatus Rokuibacteriota bacterium]|nr:MAG: hypothetical protein C5B48_03665 [Candidatus Rokubacteria bacterium]